MEKIKFRDDGLPGPDRENWDLICAICGGKWGYDHTSGQGWCINSLTGDALETKFKLSSGGVSSKKKYTKECPCGIWHGDCDYHNGS